MNAKITINSGGTQRGEKLGCVGRQIYADILDVSARDAQNCYIELYCTGPHDKIADAKAECREWAKANGIELAGDFQPRVNTGAEADIRANLPRREWSAAMNDANDVAQREAAFDTATEVGITGAMPAD